MLAAVCGSAGLVESRCQRRCATCPSNGAERRVAGLCGASAGPTVDGVVRTRRLSGGVDLAAAVRSLLEADFSACPVRSGGAPRAAVATRTRYQGGHCFKFALGK